MSADAAMGELSNESTEMPRLVPVIDGGACAGFLVNRGVCGVEAFDKDEKSLGVFPDVISAAITVEKSATPEATEGAPTPFAPVHSRFGGSVAARVLHCPASVGFVAKVPEHLRRPSVYADRGSALHKAITLLLDEKETLESLAGKTIDNYAVTTDDVENALRPVFTYIVELLDTPGAEFYLERRVAFPTIAGAFGTADLIVRIGDTIWVLDFKFGSGVRVLALTPDGADDVLNAQLLFYAAAARDSFPEFFAGIDRIVLTILQPQSIEPDAEMVSSVEVTHAELDEFIAVYRAACAEALSATPRLKRGNWCRFCAARPICPAHTGPLLDLAQFAVPTATPPSTDAYLQALAAGLDLVDAIKDLRVALHDQAKRALENGNQVPGYALSAGRAERHWRDDEHTTIAALKSLGLARDDIVAETIRTPKQMEIRAKARSLKIPQEFIVSHRSGVSLTRCENARAPAPGRGEIVRSFTAALEAFQEGGTHEPES
jgi:uncharacterized protein DUF2800